MKSSKRKRKRWQAEMQTGQESYAITLDLLTTPNKHAEENYGDSKML
jgi:hypothetical protein